MDGGREGKVTIYIMIRYILCIPQALIAEEVRNREGAKLLAMDGRKRPYNSLWRDGDNKAPMEEEMEAFRLKRQRQEDPMAAFL